MGALGYRVFEPLVRKEIIQIYLPATERNDKSIIQIIRSGANAKSRLTDEGIIVLAGSIIREQLVPNCPDYVKEV